MRKKISQREAHELRKRVARLENQEQQRNNTWSSDWPGGVHLTDIIPSEVIMSAVKTARKLGHVVVVTLSYDDKMRLIACKL